MVALMRMPEGQTAEITTEAELPRQETHSERRLSLASFARPLRKSGKLERRVFPRRTVNCRVEGVRLDHSIAARRQPRLNLALRDLSEGGAGAISDQPLAPGEQITLIFPATGLFRGWDAFGRILRCTPRDGDNGQDGYHLAIEFDTLPAA